MSCSNQNLLEKTQVFVQWSENKVVHPGLSAENGYHYKNKGIKSDFSNQRGVFNVSKVRSILDKVLYDDVYQTIDDELSYSNIGGRKGRNIRDHLFVIYAVINVLMRCGIKRRTTICTMYKYKMTNFVSLLKWMKLLK